MVVVNTMWWVLAIGQEDNPPLTETMTVKRHIVDVRVIDTFGRPVPGLTAADFELTQRGRPISILSCDWVAENAGPRAQGEERPRPATRLVVLFFQVELAAPRVRGLQDKINRAMQVVGPLPMTDRVAVLSFDSHLKLWQDFTNSEARIRTALRKALRRERAPYPEPTHALSLAGFLDQEAGKKAASPEKALAVLARALGSYRETKLLVYLGFGPADFWRGNFQLREDYPEAKRALIASRTTVIGLDFARMDYPTIDLAMRQLADDTGGFFLKTPQFTRRATNKLHNSIAGYYLISHVPPADENGRMRLRLVGQKGQILVKSPYNAWGNSATDR